MTISANDRRRDYIGNGVATTFAGPRAFAAPHIQVFTGTAPSYHLVPPSQYTVLGAGRASTSVVFNTAPLLNVDILIQRTVPLDQPTDVTNQGAFLPEIHEDAFDYRVMQLQQLADGSLQLVPDPDTGEFVWDARGNRIVRVGDAVADADALNMRGALKLIEEIQNGGGSIGIVPKFWAFVGDGQVTDFPLSGADVLNPLFYDTAVELTVGAADYLVSKPGDFQILAGGDGFPPAIRFAAPLADGQRGFTTLRGYARPWIGPTPIYTVAPRIVSITASTTLAGDMHNTLILANSATPITLTIRANTGSSVDWLEGQFFSVQQVGAGQVTLAIDGGGQMTVPVNFQPKARAVGSVISATCTAPDADAWTAAGDLLRGASSPDLQAFTLADGSALIGTNITAGTTKASMVLPFGIVLSPVAQRGIYASVSEAQPSGVPLTVDVKRNGTSILNIKLTFDNGERSTITAALPPTLVAGGDVLGAGDEITIDVQQVGTAGAKGLKVYLVGQRAS